MNEQFPFQLWLEFEHWHPQESDDLEMDCFNMQITLAGGMRYALNVWTFKFFLKTVDDCREAGENLNGTYLPAPDLFVERLDRALIERVVANLIADRGLRKEWEVNEQS